MSLKNIRFLTGCIFTILVLFLGIFTVGVYGETREWKIDDSKFENISSNSTSVIDGLTIYPGIQRYNSLRLFKGTKYYNYLYMDVSSNRNRNSVSFYLNGDSNIYIIGRSDGQDTDKRRIAFYFEETGETQYITMGPAKGYKLEYRGEATNVYINAVDDDVRIYDIAVEDYDESDYEELEEGETYSWDFSGIPYDHQFVSNQNMNGLEIYATVEKPVIAYTGNATDTGYRFYYGLDLEGSGTRDYRSLAFKVPKNSDVYITARASNYNSGNLYVTNKYECDIEDYDNTLKDSKLTVNGRTITYRIRYRGSGEKFYIKSEDGGIRINKIDIVGHSNKITNDKKWVFDNYDELTIGSYLFNKTIDELLISSNNTRPASVVSSQADKYTKAVEMTSSHFEEASKMIFKISDSSNKTENQQNSKRIIRVWARSDYQGARLILGNKYGYVYGSYSLGKNITENVFEYDGGYDDLYLFTNTGDGVHMKSEIYSISTSDIQGGEPTKINTYFTNGNTYKYNFTVENIENPSDYYYVINYDSSKLTLMNIGMDYNNSNVITDSNVQVISNTEGEIKFRVLNLNEKNRSGIITSAVFKAKATGSGTIKFSAVRG